MAKNIIIFASGTGTNAENICNAFRNDEHICVKALFCNNPQAKVIGKMSPFGISVQLFDKATFADSQNFLKLIQTYQPDLIVLAGFLWLIPPYLIQAFPKKIINIHPSLLPKYGGKGMYGMHVHHAVIDAREKEHGITIHFVTEKYDEGPPVFQAKIEVEQNDTAESVSKKIAQLEMRYFPEAIRRILGV